MINYHSNAIPLWHGFAIGLYWPAGGKAFAASSETCQILGTNVWKVRLLWFNFGRQTWVRKPDPAAVGEYDHDHPDGEYI